MEAAFLYKLRKTECKETGTGPDTRKSKCSCVVETSGSTRKRLEGTQPKDYEDHSAGRGFNSLSHYNLVHKFIPLPQAIKNTGSESRSGQRMGEHECLAADESQKQKRGHAGGTEEKEEQFILLR